jgi:HK97 family phage prohead protease
MALRTKDFDLFALKTEADGRFSGLGSVFGNVDSYGEIVAPGAFTATLAEIAAKGRPIPALWQHRRDEPIGVYDELREDAAGLHVAGRLLTDVSKAREAYVLMRAGAVSGLSIGFIPRASSLDEKTGIRTLTQVDLKEVSLVTFPANDEARIETVKAASIRSAELRELLAYLAGFSLKF